MKMQKIQFESIVNLIQMKLMKVIHTHKNMMIQESQHFEEFQLIEVMKMKMQKSRFRSIANLTQTRLTGLYGKHSKVSGPKRKPNQESMSRQTLHRLGSNATHPSLNHFPQLFVESDEFRFAFAFEWF
jgi:hypothetical protein